MIIALDFDGVICDSAGEMAISAWRAAAQLWPAEFAGEAPADFVEDFRRLRPGLETGYQSILLARLLRDGVELTAESAVAATAAVPHDRDELVRLFGATRDAWIAGDLPGWLAAHRFYPGALDFLRRSQACARVVVITTKQTRFAQALLEGVLAPEAVFGLETGDKVGTLCELRKEDADVHFVEDRLDTLLRVADCPDLGSVHLYLVDWGYNTSAQRREAGQHPRIQVLTRDFAALASLSSA
jgi:phosphoglycolate phosphatase-like HAD superfamily hydrolase